MKIIKSFGRLQIGQNAHGALCVTDGWLTDWITFYRTGDWRRDSAGIRLTKAVTVWLDKEAAKRWASCA